MSGKERVRLDAMRRVKRGELSVVAASELMGVSLRQGRRVWKGFKSSGDAGVVHKLRGRASNRRLSEDVRERIVSCTRSGTRTSVRRWLVRSWRASTSWW